MARNYTMNRHIAAIFVALMTTISIAQELPKREFRGAWLHIIGNKQMRTMTTAAVKQMLVSTLDSLEKAGCNAIIFQVRPTADAFYQSDIEPWTQYLTGVQGLAPNPMWDPLQFMIDQSHKRGMELHAWLNPYRVTANIKDVLSTEHIYYKKPEIFRKYGEQIYFDPAEPESRKHTVKVIVDIVSRYDVDAIHLDDYFYPYPIKGEEFPDDISFVKYATKQGFKLNQKSDWRRHNVAILMKEINEAIKALKPWVRFGISPFGIHRNLKDTPDGSGSRTNGLSNYDELFADVPDWARKGIVDYIVPQIYWKIGHPAADYTTLIEWWNKGNFGAQLYIGQGISTLTEADLKNPKITQIAEKMRLVRELKNVDGNVWWPGWSIPKNEANIYDNLATRYQRYPALILAYTKLDATPPPAVAKIAMIGDKITWEVTPTKDKMQEPLFYAVYKFPVGTAININDTRYLIKITNSTKYTMTDKKPHNYVVTVIDRCWNESEGTEIN